MELLEALDTINNLGTMVPKNLTESQLRPLTNLEAIAPEKNL